MSQFRVGDFSAQHKTDETAKKPKNKRFKKKTEYHHEDG